MPGTRRFNGSWSTGRIWPPCCWLPDWLQRLHSDIPCQRLAPGPLKNGGSTRTFAVLPHQAHWFHEGMDLGALSGSPDDVIQMVVALLS